MRTILILRIAALIFDAAAGMTTPARGQVGDEDLTNFLEALNALWRSLLLDQGLRIWALALDDLKHGTKNLKAGGI